MKDGLVLAEKVVAAPQLADQTRAAQLLLRSVATDSKRGAGTFVVPAPFLFGALAPWAALAVRARLARAALGNRIDGFAGMAFNASSL